MATLTTDFNHSQSSDLLAFTQGLDVDVHLFEQEIRVQMAWLEALRAANIFNDADFKILKDGLHIAQEKMRRQEFDWKIEDEDIHMNLERFLVGHCGEVANRIHLGRSRNDLIATTLRLFTHDSLLRLRTGAHTLLLALLDQAEKNIDVIVPGYTHMQAGQPIRLSQLFSAHAHSFERDLKVISRAALDCIDVMPLGAAAFAGTNLNLDLELLAKSLGFSSPPRNTLDSIADRDFLIGTLHAIAMLGVHCARFCEDMIYWSSTAVGLIELPREWSTGSSIMANKRNPDVAEIIRAKSARLLACLTEAMEIVKSVPTSYASDFHELKRTLLRATNEAHLILGVLPHFVKGLQVNERRARELLMQGHILATDIANERASKGSSFRIAYQEAAALVEQAQARGVQVHELEPLFGTDKDPFVISVETHNNSGGTSRARAQESYTSLRKRLSEIV